MQLRRACVWILIAACPALAAAQSSLPSRITTFADLLGLAAKPEVRGLFTALERVSLHDPGATTFTPFDPLQVRRIVLTGMWRGAPTPVRVETPVWVDEGTARCGINYKHVVAAMKSVAPEAAPDRLARMGAKLIETRVRGTGVAGLVTVELLAEMKQGGFTFRGPVTFEIHEERGMRPTLPRLPDLMRCAATALANPVFKLLATSRGAAAPLEMTRGAGTLEIALRTDREVGEGRALGLGGTFRIDLETGEGGFRDFTLPIADLARTGVRDLEALAARPELRWMRENADVDEHVAVGVRPGGWLVRADSGKGFKIELAVGERVDVVFANLPPLAYGDPLKKREAVLRGLLVELAHVATVADMERLAKNHPDQLLLVVTQAEEALRRGDRAGAKAHAVRARAVATEAERRWRAARTLAERGELAQAAAALLDALERCAIEHKLWAARRRLLLAVGERPGELPRELPAFVRAGHGWSAGAMALIPRIGALERTLGIPAPLIERGAVVPGKVQPQVGAIVVGARWPKWTVAGLGREEAADGPGRTVASLRPPAGAALEPLRTLHAFPTVAEGGRVMDDGLPESVDLVRDVLRRIGNLHVGDAALGGGSAVDLWLEPISAALLLPAPGEEPRVSPDVMLASMGTLAGPLVARAFRETVWVVAFRVEPGPRSRFTGQLIGIDVPALDATRLTRLELPAGQIGLRAARELLERVFDPARVPPLSKPEVRLADGKLEVSYLPTGREHEQLARVMRVRNPYVVLEAGRIAMDPGALGGRAGALSIEP
jgi:hypothetical protein